MQKVIPLLFSILFLTFINPLNAQVLPGDSVSLSDLFRIADQNNRSLKISAYDEQLAAEEIQQQKNKQLPTVDASMSFSYNGNGWLSERDFSKGMLAPVPHFGNNFALEATQLIYAGGGPGTSVQNAKLGLRFARLDSEKNKQDIRFLIAGYYLELQKLQNQQEILRHNIRQTNKLLQQIRDKHKEGLALKNAVTRYELQKQSLELALLKLENSQRIINHELVKNLQLPAGTFLLLRNAVNIPMEEHILINWQNKAEANAPVLKQMETVLRQAKGRETLARSERLPKVFAFAGDRFDGPITVEVPPVNKNLNYWYAGLGIKYNIASLYNSQAKIKASKIATQKAMETRAMVQEQLAVDIESGSIHFMEAKEVYQTQLKGVQLAAENYNVIRNRYLDDLVLMTEMLDAENSMIDAEMQAANSRITVLFYYYQLKNLSGTL